MSDDTRQARIEAAMTAYDDVMCTFWPKMEFRERVRQRGIAAMGAALEAADAIGRERVSEASGWDVIRAFRDAYNAEASAMGIPTTDQHSQDVAMCQAAGAFAVARLFLTAAPAERGDE